MNAIKVAKLFGCTVEQAQSLYERNARQLQSMANKARRSGRKVNHYTAAQLDARAAAFRAQAGI